VPHRPCLGRASDFQKDGGLGTWLKLEIEPSFSCRQRFRRGFENQACAPVQSVQASIRQGNAVACQPDRQLVAAPLATHALRLPPNLVPTTIIALRLTALGFVGRTLANVFNTPQLVRLRLDLFTIVTTGRASHDSTSAIASLTPNGFSKVRRFVQIRMKPSMTTQARPTVSRPDSDARHQSRQLS